MSSYLVALVRPVITCLVAGGLKTLEDYQANPKWVPALVDGGITAGVVAASLLGIQGATSGAQKVATTSAAKSSPTT